MVYIALGVTIIVSAMAFHFWLGFFARRVHFKNPDDMADASMGEADLVGFLLPRPVRRIWNWLVVTASFLVLGIPHPLVIWNFWRQRELAPSLYAHYVWTLVYQVALIALCALIIVRHRGSRSRRPQPN